jgi:hypothetical protein
MDLYIHTSTAFMLKCFISYAQRQIDLFPLQEKEEKREKCGRKRMIVKVVTRIEKQRGERVRSGVKGREKEN